MGETRVDLLHLLEDLRDAYPGRLEETILTEMIANSLDSGANRICLHANSTEATLTIVDNGSGMHRRELARYHDIAASTKTRGQGIGFAGVGIKLGLLVSQEVITETKRGKSHVATWWHLSSRYRAPWKWGPPPGRVSERGTAVQLRLQNALSPLLDPGFLEEALRRHFQPLLDPTFDSFLSSHYPSGVVLEVNGYPMEKKGSSALIQAPLEIRMMRKRKASALGYLIRSDIPLPEENRGLAVSTYGKIIKRGWDWIGVNPTSPEGVGGLIEVPSLASSLTLNKGDFIRVGTRGANYLAFRKAIQEAVSRQLSMWGDSQGASQESPPRHMRPLERDLERVLEDLSDSFPLLASLVERRPGGQKRLPLGTPGDDTDVRAVVSSLVLTPKEEEEKDQDLLETSRESKPEEGKSEGEPEPEPTTGNILLPDHGGPKRPARYGLEIQFEDRGDDLELGRLVESTVWVNQGHPAYRRALASRTVGYHIALTVALALAPLAVEPAGEHAFLNSFLARWGEVLDQSTRSPRRRRPPKSGTPGTKGLSPLF